MGKDRWKDISTIILMVFMTSFMYILKTYQALGAKIFETKNGIIFMAITIALFIATTIAFTIRLRGNKK